MAMQHIVKRSGNPEPYDARKVYASIYSAALSMREPVGSAELIAGEVVKHVETWLAPKHMVTSNDIRRVAANHLKELHAGIAFQYLHHRVVW